MKEKYKKQLISILGYFFLILGIIGCFLPILQGFLFIFIGLALLSNTTDWAKKLLVRFRKKHPNIAKKADQFLNKFKLRSKNP